MNIVPLENVQIQSNVLTPVFNIKNAKDRVLFIMDEVLCTAPKVCYHHVKNLEPEQKRLHVMQMRVVAHSFATWFGFEGC